MCINKHHLNIHRSGPQVILTLEEGSVYSEKNNFQVLASNVDLETIGLSIGF